MGILADSLDMVRALELPRRFAVCELGDQFVTEPMPRVLAREVYQQMGCGRYVSIDANGLNDALPMDLNKPIRSRTLVGRFDLVTDFGTGEHVFDQKTVWFNVHNMCKPGGVVAFDRPCQGYDGHCYYLISEELIRDLADANEYEILTLSYRDMPRGRLIRGAMRRTSKKKFHVPYQGRYLKSRAAT